jgi:recombination protein RecT
VRKNPDLARCDPYSFLGAVMQCAQLGLEPGSGLGHAYLIPFNNRKLGIMECQLIPGYRGLMDLAYRSGQVLNIKSNVVHQADRFDWEEGTKDYIDHKRYMGLQRDAGDITHFYSIAWLKNGGVQFEVMSIDQVEEIRDSGNKNPVWEKHFIEMGRKTAIRRLAKSLPMTVEYAQALELDDKEYKGESQENWRTIDANYTPLPAQVDPAKAAAVMADGGTAMDTPADQAKTSADRDNAVMEFNKAVEGVLARGGYPVQIVGNYRLDNMSADELWTKADILSAWEKLK